MKTIITIPFAGCPASGKSSTLKSLRNMTDPRSSAAVHFLPEIADAVLKNMPKDVGELNKPLIQQHYIHRCQLLFEDALRSDCAANDGHDVHLLLTDRAAADAFVYLEERDALIVTGGLSDESLLARYNAVLFFETSPDARERFLSDRSMTRVEKSFDEVLRLDERSLEVWGKHRRFFRIPYQDTPEAKAVLTAQTLNRIVGTRVFEV